MKKVLLIIGIMSMISCTSKEQKLRTKIIDLESKLRKVEYAQNKLIKEKLKATSEIRRIQNRCMFSGGGMRDKEGYIRYGRMVDSIDNLPKFIQKQDSLRKSWSQVDKELSKLKKQLYIETGEK